jgi:hypothetical protein
MRTAAVIQQLGLLVVMLCAVFVLVADAAPLVVRVSNFSEAGLHGWEEKSFKGNSRYRLVEGEQGKVLHATTRGEASGLFKEVDIDLDKTPYLNWSWRVENVLSQNDERSKDGDDYPARVYVVVSGGILFWKTRAVNYVWSSNQAAGSHWPNAFTDHAQMLALRSGTARLGQWVAEKRDVRADLKKLFGEDIQHIDAVALMVDGDNTGQSAAASFGDIYFSSE